MEKLNLLYLNKKEIEGLDIKLSEIIDITEKVFVEKGKGNVEMPPKPGIHTRKNAFIHAMPAYIPAMEAAGIKWVGGYPENYKRGLPYISGLLILNDPDTGVPFVVMDCIWITTWRTAAATAVAAKYLANSDSKMLGILGCGVQGKSNLEALNEIFHLKNVKIYDISQEKSNDYKKEMGEKLGIDIDIKDNPEEVVRDSDIIVTAGPFLENPTPVIDFSWLKEGAFCCPLDLDSYFKPDVFLKSDIVCTDDVTQFNNFREKGFFKEVSSEIYDLGDVVYRKSPKRENEKQIIVSINIGLALEDMGLAKLVYSRAMERNIGVKLDLYL